MTTTNSHAYRADIDGLRAISVLAVVAYHTGIPGIRGGFVGVDVFFVISGFLITGLLLAEIETRGRLRFGHFYARRVRRILPTLVLVTVTTLVAAIFMLTPALGEVQGVGQSAISAMLMVSNYYFLAKSANYFAGPAAFEPLLHTWSLAVEEQYYLVWPVLISLVSMIPGKNKRRRVGFTLLFVLAASFAVAAWLATWRNPWAFYLAPARAWELAAGGLIAVFQLGPAKQNQSGIDLGSSAGIVGLAIILAAAFSINANAFFPIPSAIAPVLGAVFIIYGGARSPNNPVSRLLSTNTIVQIGKASYAWYLWHWPVLSIARILTLGLPNLPRDVALSCLTLVDKI